MNLCYAKKKNGDLCNTKLTEKNRHEINIENQTYFVCGRHKNIKSIDDITIYQHEKINDKNDDLHNIVNNFDKKIWGGWGDELTHSKFFI